MVTTIAVFIIYFKIHKPEAQFLKIFSRILLPCREEFYKPKNIFTSLNWRSCGSKFLLLSISELCSISIKDISQVKSVR